MSKFLVHATHILNYLEQAPEAISLLERYGFSAQRLPEGKFQIEQLQRVSAELEDLVLQQKAATEAFHSQWKELAALHQVHLHAARRCLQQSTPQLLGALPQTYAGWSAQVRRFYTVILAKPEYQAKLNGLGVPSEELQRAHQWLDTLTANKDQQNLSRHKYRMLKQQRDATLVELRRWVEALLALARIAFRDQPALRKMLRPLRTRSSNTSQNESNPSQVEADEVMPMPRAGVAVLNAAPAVANTSTASPSEAVVVPVAAPSVTVTLV